MFDTAAMAAKSSFWPTMRSRMSSSACTRSLALLAARRRGIPRWYVRASPEVSPLHVQQMVERLGGRPGTGAGGVRITLRQRPVDQPGDLLDGRHPVGHVGVVAGQDRDRIVQVMVGEVADAVHVPQV